MISKFQAWGDLGPSWAVAPQGEKIIVVVNYVVLFKEVVSLGLVSVFVVFIYSSLPSASGVARFFFVLEVSNHIGRP